MATRASRDLAVRNATAVDALAQGDALAELLRPGTAVIVAAMLFARSLRANERAVATAEAEASLTMARGRAEREPELLRQGPGFVFYALMDAVVDRYFPHMDAIEAELEKLESTMFQPRQDRQAVVQQLFGLKQRLALAACRQGLGLCLTRFTLARQTLRQGTLKPLRPWRRTELRRC